MSNETINSELQKEVSRECMIKEAAKKAQLSHKQRQYIARTQIEDLRELKRIEDEYILSEESGDE